MLKIGDDSLHYLNVLREENPLVQISSETYEDSVEITVRAKEKLARVSAYLFAALDTFSFCYNSGMICFLLKKVQIDYGDMYESQGFFKVSISCFKYNRNRDWFVVEIRGDNEQVRKAFALCIHYSKRKLFKMVSLRFVQSLMDDFHDEQTLSRPYAHQIISETKDIMMYLTFSSVYVT